MKSKGLGRGRAERGRKMKRRHRKGKRTGKPS
jgi:hypothetical protein